MAKRSSKQPPMREVAEGRLAYSEATGEQVTGKPSKSGSNVPGRSPYASRALEVAHGLAADLHAVGLYSPRTMREFDALCLTTVRPITPQDIKELRARERVSQAVLAAYLNVTTSSVAQWERGEKRPAGAAQKLLALAIDKGLVSIA